MLGQLATAAALAVTVAAQQPSAAAEGPQDLQQWEAHPDFSASSQQFSQVNGWISPEYTWLFEFPLPIPAVAAPLAAQTINGTNVEFYNGTIEKFQQQVYPNLGPANLVGYNGTSPGPSFKIQSGTQSVHRWTNNGDTGASVHVHGSHARSSFDGWAADELMPGQFKDYYYPNDQSGRSLWYHDHAETHTSEDAYFGQAGSFIITDPTEDALGLPTGDYDIPLIMIDKIYGADGDLVSPQGETMNFFGDVMHVNGQPWPYLKVEPRKYRFRLLNCCLSRPMQMTLGLDATGSQETFQVIASDGGLFTSVVNTTSMYISMGERYDIVIDFANYTNSNLTLGNILNWGLVPEYAQTSQVMRFVVGDTVTNSSSNLLPQTLANVTFPPARPTIDHVFAFDHNGQNWTINGADFSETTARILARPPQGSVETWELRYASGPGFHPVHIHLIQFQVVNRTGGRGMLEPYETAGMKDVVLVAPGEVVTVTAKYGPWNGLYMFHCHNLIHEDHFMMDVFETTANPILQELGYGDSLTIFDNPQAPEYAPANVDPSMFTLDYVTDTLLPDLVNGPAYQNRVEIIAALSSYYLTATYGEPATATSATSAMAYATSAPGGAWSMGGGFGGGDATPSVSATDVKFAPVSYEAGAPFTFTDTIPTQITALSVAVVAATNPAEVTTHYYNFASHSFAPSGPPSWVTAGSYGPPQFSQPTGFPQAGGEPSTVEAAAPVASSPAPSSSTATPAPPPPPSTSTAAPPPPSSTSAPAPQQPTRPVAPSFGPPGGGFPWQQPSVYAAPPSAPSSAAPAPAPAAPSSAAPSPAPAAPSSAPAPAPSPAAPAQAPPSSPQGPPAQWSPPSAPQWSPPSAPQWSPPSAPQEPPQAQWTPPAMPSMPAQASQPQGWSQGPPAGVAQAESQQHGPPSSGGGGGGWGGAPQGGQGSWGGHKRAERAWIA